MWLLKPKPPRAKTTCNYCNKGFGLTRPNYPFCKPACRESFNKAVYGPPDELVTLLRYSPEGD
jgi:hypothetical protein